jgi:hypothetical protein
MITKIVNAMLAHESVIVPLTASERERFIESGRELKLKSSFSALPDDILQHIVSFACPVVCTTQWPLFMTWEECSHDVQRAVKQGYCRYTFARIINQPIKFLGINTDRGPVVMPYYTTIPRLWTPGLWPGAQSGRVHRDVIGDIKRGIEAGTFCRRGRYMDYIFYEMDFPVLRLIESYGSAELMAGLTFLLRGHSIIILGRAARPFMEAGFGTMLTNKVSREILRLTDPDRTLLHPDRLVEFTRSLEALQVLDESKGPQIYLLPTDGEHIPPIVFNVLRIFNVHKRIHGREVADRCLRRAGKPPRSHRRYESIKPVRYDDHTTSFGYALYDLNIDIYRHRTGLFQAYGCNFEDREALRSMYYYPKAGHSFWSQCTDLSPSAFIAQVTFMVYDLMFRVPLNFTDVCKLPSGDLITRFPERTLHTFLPGSAHTLVEYTEAASCDIPPNFQQLSQDDFRFKRFLTQLAISGVLNCLR